MKSRFVILILSLLLYCEKSIYAESINFGWNEWKPFMFKDERGVLKGVDVEIVQAILQDMGVSMNPYEAPYARQIEEMKNNSRRIMMTAGEGYNKKNESWGVYSKAYRKGKVVLFVLKGSSTQFPINCWTDIIKFNMHLGILRGSANSGGEEFLTLFDTDQNFNKCIEEVNNNYQNFDKLMAGRIQGIICGIYSGSMIIKEKNYQKK